MFEKLKNICSKNYANICLENVRIYVRKINICFIDGNICFEN